MQNEALKRGCQQVLWLYGPDEQITEVGTMNLFIYWTNENGGQNPGLVLPGALISSCRGLFIMSRSCVSAQRRSWSRLLWMESSSRV